MKNILKYIVAVLVYCSFYSCSLKEEFEPTSTNGGAVELVARVIDFNNVDVTTKASSNIETDIYTAYLLLFDKDTKERIYFTSVTASNGSFSQTITDPTVWGSSVTACFIVNVSESFAKGIEGATKPNNAPESDNNKYLDSAVLPITYSNGVPVLDHDNNSETSSVQCIPMYGSADIDNLTSGHTVEVPVTRLFAKVTLKLSMDLKDTGTIGGQLNTCFNLSSLKLCNLPMKVLLKAPTVENYESPWVAEDDWFMGEVGYPTSNTTIYNKNAINISGGSKEYSFECYLPEYYLLPLSRTDSQQGDNYGKQEYKPKVYSTDKNPAYIELNGAYNPVTGNDVSLKYRIFLGEDAATSFTLKRNHHYINTVIITGISETDLDHRVEVQGNLDLNDVYGEVANCYIISGTGQYSIRAYKGAYKYTDFATAPKCSGTTIEIIAQDKDQVVFANPDTPFVVTYDEDGVGTITFNVTEINYDCNMVIAIMKDGVQEWSWHLWFIKELEGGLTNTGYFQLGTQVMPNNAKDNMLDRNLGATLAVSDDWIGGVAPGFYYKYGHRAPYFEDKLKRKQYHGDLNDYSAWNVKVNGKSVKAVSDPCPPGYKVPSSDVWSGNATKEHASHNWAVYNFTAFRYWNNETTSALDGGLGYLLDDIYYPYSGYVSDGAVNSGAGLDTTPTTLTAQYTISVKTDYKPEGDIWNAGLVQYQKQSFTEYEYSQFSYQINLQTTHCGYLWGEDGFLRYATSSTSNCENLKILSCKCRTRKTERTMRRTYSIWNGGYGAWEESILPAEGDWSAYGDVDANQKVQISAGNTGSINNSDWQSKLRSNQSNKTVSYANNVPLTFPSNGSAPNISYGYQVRCVQE